MNIKEIAEWAKSSGVSERELRYAATFMAAQRRDAEFQAPMEEILERVAKEEGIPKEAILCTDIYRRDISDARHKVMLLCVEEAGASQMQVARFFNCSHKLVYRVIHKIKELKKGGETTIVEKDGQETDSIYNSQAYRIQVQKAVELARMRRK